MGCAAESIALDDVRASQQRQALRHQLHERFDRWLDAVEAHLPEADPTLAQVSETIWQLRQPRTAGVVQTLVEQTYHQELRRASLRCPPCGCPLKARPAVPRTARTMSGDIERERPYCYGRDCHLGRYPLDQALGLQRGRLQLDVQQAAADLALE